MLTAIVVLSSAVLLAGCGGEDPPSRAGTIDDPSATADPVISPKPDQAPEQDFDEAGRQLTKAQAKAALPRVSVLPAGWSVDPDDTLTGPDEADSQDKVTPARCQVLFDGLEQLNAVEPAAKAGVTYTAGMLGPFLGVEISSYNDEVPEDRFGKVLEALNQCPKFSVDDGKSVTPYTVSALSFPNYGQESAAMRMSATSEGTPVALDLVVIRVGHNVVTVSQAALGGAGPVTPLKKAARATMGNLNRG